MLNIWRSLIFDLL